MDIFLSLLAIALMILGIAGAILPLLPGPALSFLGLVSLYFTSTEPFTLKFLGIWLLLTVVVSVVDQIIPILGTKKMGGSKYGVWGSAIGLVAGIFLFPPIGIIVGPFLGALIGELLGGMDFNKALRAAVGSFIGFLSGTILKVIFGIIAGYYIVVNVHFA
jgi:uncharacterized protein YqgC (DUF456 family)